MESISSDEAGGRAWAASAQLGYDLLLGCLLTALARDNAVMYAWCMNLIYYMDGIDYYWDRITSPGDNSDGIVQGVSKIYPGRDQQYTIRRSDSHVGETRSTLVRNQMRIIFDTHFSTLIRRKD